MKILFTGASSFTGYWFIKALAASGHEIFATLRRPAETYSGVRRMRLQQLGNLCRLIEGVSFGDDAFLRAIEKEPNWDLLCHHAADVEGYKNLSFNVSRALRNNTNNIDSVMRALLETGCKTIALTGSVFECNEGAGSGDGKAFSPYGLSKSFTAEVFRYWAHNLGFTLGKFVIPNPFGPYEEPRFTSYLARDWLAREIPLIQTPDYVRDNIHVSLLAADYRWFVEGLSQRSGFSRRAPSGYIGSQGGFAALFAHKMESRLGIRCEIKLLRQEKFDEPRIRINTDVPSYSKIDWDEENAWDELAEYYKATFAHV